jgi:hydrogenase maturation protein HypF
MPGGDVATKEIWRLALSLLNKHNKISAVPNSIKKEKLYIRILSLLNSDIKKPQVCSAGRYLDAMAAICEISNFCSYEGQTAAHLESFVKKNSRGFYPFDLIHKENNISEIQFSKTIESLVQDLKNKISLEQISGKIHETICRIILKQSLFFCKKFAVKQIALSGGVFQNKYILSKTIKLLEKENFKVFYNKLVPINDGGISLGQAYMLHKKTAVSEKRSRSKKTLFLLFYGCHHFLLSTLPFYCFDYRVLKHIRRLPA